VLDWFFKMLFPRRYARMNYLHVTRDDVPLDPRRLKALLDAASAGDIKELLGLDKADRP
jgi:hypothetical protein